jgi:hypothetical protein
MNQLSLWDERVEVQDQQLAQAKSFWACFGWSPEPGRLCHISTLVVPIEQCESVPDSMRPQLTLGRCFYVCGERARINALFNAEVVVTIESRKPDWIKNGLRFRLALHEIGPSFVQGEPE